MFEWFLSINSLFSGYHDKEIITLTLFIPSLFVLTSLFLIALYLSSFLSPLEVSHLFSYCHYSFHSSYPLSHSLFLSRYSPSVSSATMISPFFPLIAIKFGSSHEHVVYYFQSSVMSLSLNYPFYFTQSSYTAFSRLSPISLCLSCINKNHSFSPLLSYIPLPLSFHLFFSELFPLIGQYSKLFFILRLLCWRHYFLISSHLCFPLASPSLLPSYLSDHINFHHL